MSTYRDDGGRLSSIGSRAEEDTGGTSIVSDIWGLRKERDLGDKFAVSEFTFDPLAKKSAARGAS